MATEAQGVWQHGRRRNEWKKKELGTREIENLNRSGKEKRRVAW